MLVFFNLLRPLSLRRLILAGFALSVLPLVVALVSTVLALEELAAFSQVTAYRVAQMSQKNESLREKLTDFERKGKRYLVLDDPESRLAFEETRREFAEVLDNLLNLARNPELVAALHQLIGDRESVFRQILASPPAETKPSGGEQRRPPATGVHRTQAGTGRLARADELFADLNGKARQLARGFSEVVDTEVSTLESKSRTVQRRMLALSSVLLPISLGLISLLTFLIIRSIRQMDRAIRRLGAGDFVCPIQVIGPKDLEYLGERLDWLRSRLLALEEAKQQFIRNVSHEIKTPLATIHEGTDLLADEVVGELNTEQREIAQILVNNTQKLETLIVGLINYSQVNARPGALAREKVDMRALVAAIIEDYRIRLRTKSISLKEALRPVEVDGNPEQLRTIVDNLLSNAVKYSPNGGEIRIGLRQAGGNMELEIEDDGPGIEPDERSHVFEPFFQGRATQAGGVVGTGLGLAIVSECVVGHRGKVDALEPRPDKHGARIRVSIPLRIDIDK
jgi:two-component system sensor histidine kinase GlrK